MRFSIIIPVKQINQYIQESVPYILALDYNNFEVIILPDNGNIAEINIPPSELCGKVRVISTGHCGPADKRDIGARNADGDILAFLDDDAYPRKDWLTNARPHFEKDDIAAVGGPAVTPNDDPLMAKVSGAVYLSPLGGGSCDRYWPQGSSYCVDDWPSVNLFVRKNDFIKAGGFDSSYWPGEDTKLCLDIVHKHNKKIIYDPVVLVWHHRRSGFKKHLHQIAGYGIHRGFFAKKYPQTSLKLKYFIPSLFTLFMAVGLILSPFSNLIRLLFAAGVSMYSLGLFYSFIIILAREKNLLVALFALPYIFFTHVIYGVQFLRGYFFTKNLKSKLKH
ncbi:MAG: glycosyltransferase [Pseudomonadota bacterium]